MHTAPSVGITCARAIPTPSTADTLPPLAGWAERGYLQEKLFNDEVRPVLAQRPRAARVRDVGEVQYSVHQQLPHVR
jgi:hypothetical protein